MRDAGAEHEEMRKWLRVEPGEDLGAAIRRKQTARGQVLESNRLLRELQKQGYTLMANRNGVVSRIFATPGNVVAAGQEIMRLVSEKSNRIIGFLPEIHLHDLEIGDTFVAFRPGPKNRQVPATVVSIAPEVQALPGRISPIRDQPLRGRRVVLQLEGQHDFIPGETVQMRSDAASGIDLWSKLIALFTKWGNDSSEQEQ